MRILPVITILLLPLLIKAQSCVPVGKEDYTILVFEEPVLDSEPTNDEFVVFTATGKGAFKQGKKMLKVKLNKASEGKREASLLVITQGGQRHEIVLYPEKNPEKLIYYFDAGKPLFNSRTKSRYAVSDSGENLFEDKEVPKWADTLRCRTINRKPAWIARETTKKQGIYFTVKGTYNGKEAIYIPLSIRNESGQRYDVKSIAFSKVPKIRSKGADSSEPIVDEEFYVFQEPKKVMPGSETHFVAVLKRFTLNSRRDVLIEIEEVGERIISNRVPHDLINNPKRL